jgi:membrane fusion protein (multidrug efflux system)
VRVERARLDAFEDRVEALGTLRANESVALAAPVTDIVSAIHFEDGQRVEKGQILVEMVTAEEKALKTEAIAAVEEARSQFLRAKDLAARKFTSESLLDQRRREFETAEARLKAIEARLADRVVVAPFAGTIGLRTISLGALVEPDRPIARLEDDSVMKLDFSVPSTFLAALKPGLPIVARARGYDGETFTGSLTSVDNAVDEVTRTIRVRALIPNPDRRLKPGLLMTVDLLKTPRTAVVVPEEALVPAGGNVYVFVVDEASRKVERRPVVMGARRAGEVEVAQGLEDGELVVTEGGLKLAPGMTVVVDDGPPAAAPALSDEAKGTGGRS